MNRASSREMASTVITTAGSGHQYSPVVPGRNITGRKATMLVRMAKVTGAAMSRAPMMADSSPPMPRWRYS